MYLIISAAVSRVFSGRIDQAIFPTVFRIGHVRFYQRASGRQRTSCSPPDHPTAGWIAQHWWANLLGTF